MQRRSDTVVHTETASAAAAADNLRLESVPALRDVGVQIEHWSVAQQLVRCRVLSRSLQALLREALLSVGRLVADTHADVTLLSIWQQRVSLRFTGLRPGVFGSWILTSDVAVLAHDRPLTPIERPSALLHWLAPMLDMGDTAEAHRPAVIDRLTAELDNSRDSDTLCQAYRPAWGARLAAEHRTAAWQDALALLCGDSTPHALAHTEQRGTDGHPQYSAYKIRLGLVPGQVIALSPEFEAQIPPGVVVVAAYRLQVTMMDGAQPYANQFVTAFPQTMAAFRRALLARQLAPEAQLSLPVHPWQRDTAPGEIFAAEFAADELIRLSDINIAARPAMSSRTVAAAGAPGGVVLKLPVSMRLASVECTVSPRSAVMGPRVSALLERILANDAALASVLSIVPEHHGIHLAGTDGERARHLSMIVHDNPTMHIAGDARLLPVGTLLTPDFTADMTHAAVPLLFDTVLARQADGTCAERAARFFDAYLHVAIPAIVGPYLRYGTVLEAHQQNILVVIDKVGMPVRLVVRDLGDAKIALSALQTQGFSTEPLRAGHTMYPDRDILCRKLIHAFLLCHIGELALALFPEHGSAVGLRQWHDTMQAVSEVNCTALGADTWKQERHVLLEAPWSFKTFVRICPRDQPDDIHVALPSPLADAVRT